ncbi:MAG TPA: aldolase/citrate lyase family protein [Dehalococcoidia bacterium]|nr:aldolase/citrate lyase family protein [Dehalococcoidia bacterium]
MPQQVRRSWLIIPATKPDLIERSGTFGADVIVFDLEDMVHESRKFEARARIKDGIAQARHGGAEVFVRCDLELLYADLEASVWRGLDGVILPKVSRVDEINDAEEILGRLELERGVVRAALAGEVNEADDARTLDNSLELHLSLENAKGNHDGLALMTASRRIRSVSLGRADLVMDLRPEPSGDLHLLPYLMQRLIIMAKTAGVTPIGAWWQSRSRGMRAGPEVTERAARLGRAAGFKGALCVDPDQVDALNRGFTPTLEEVDTARSIAEAFSDAEAAGRPYAQVGDALIDRAGAGASQACLDWAAECAAREAGKARLAQTV